MKKITLLIILLFAIDFSYGQICNVSDDFNRGNNTIINQNWVEIGGNVSISSNELIINTGGTVGRNYIYQDVSNDYNTQLGLLPSLITWTFNMQQTRVDPSGFNNNNYGIAFVLGGTSSDFNIGDGYAVVLGQFGIVDNVRLVSYTDGIDLNSNLTDIIVGAADYGNEHLSIKVTYDSTTDIWELFVRNDGGLFSDPSTLSLTDSQGTAMNNLHTVSNLDFVGMFWNHATGASEISKFDNVCINTAIICSSPTTTWSAGSWSNGVPDLYTPAVINDNYNTVNGGNEVSFSACNLTINNGYTLNIANSTFVEVQNNIIANGNINVQPQGAVVQVDDGASVLGSGIITVSKRTAPANNWYEYTYWSSPVNGADINNGLAESDVNRRFEFIAENFLDATSEVNNNGAALAGQDDIDDNGNDWQYISGSTPMEPGVGYASTMDPTLFSIGPGNQFIYTFEGPFNNGVITVPIYRNDSELNDYNWNLIGNPYPSAIDADLFLVANSNVATNVSGTDNTGTSYIDGAIFLWSQNTAPSSTANGNQQLNFSNDDFAIINAMGEIRGGDGIQPNRFIPSGQGFFVSMANPPVPATLVSGDIYTADVVFNNSMRVTNTSANSQFFKNSNSKKENSTNAYNKLWIDLTSDNGVYNQILVGYVNGATHADDGIGFDTHKYPTNGAALYSTIENSNKKFAIQGKAPSDLTESEIINLGFKTTINVATLYTLSIGQFQGDFINNSPVFLIDNLLNKTHDLRVCDYTFTSEVGEFNSRFQIAFSDKALSTNDFGLNNNALKIIELDNDRVNFKLSDNLKIKTVTIFDLLGRQLYNLKGNNSSETYKLSKLKNTVYIAKVELLNGAIITKKAIKR